MQQFDTKIVTITEGATKILVPEGAINEKVPPKEPAFFNPRAKLNRDLSIIVYSAFIKKFEGPKIFLEGLSGLGARGLRVANEIKQFEKIILNDLNPSALELAKESARLNELNNIEISEKETCRFFSKFSKKGERGTIIDIDPFGSPAKFLDCGIRATMHNGMLSVTATDLQVLNGLFDNACKRRYGGVPIRVEFGNEIAIRLILGCLRHITGRLDIEFQPLFVESDQHYYRIFVRVLNRPDQEENLGYVFHCKNCSNRGTSLEKNSKCSICDQKLQFAGPLWIGRLFEREFLEDMSNDVENLLVDKICSKNIKKCFLESNLPATYFTLDEIASKMKISPLSLDKTIQKLQENGFVASPTSLNPTGFRTDAKIDQMKEIFS
ncbi:MAG: tRNA (guanine-N1)-methyltransferase [Nitrosopumilaceae archaeon]|nr:tRNA (guanine-N1)-methyltransferase [Nitrosopumilaceae archaeon]